MFLYITDLLIKAKSGTGKTLVFCTIILERFDVKIIGPQSLIIVPTREVALQTESYLNSLSTSIPNFKAACVIGGRGVNEDRKRVNKCTAIVGTPGRLLHLLNNNVIQTQHIKILVLDECDKLLSMGFRNDIKTMLSVLNRNQQIIASSATFADDVDKLLLSFMKNPIAVSANRDAPVLLGIKQFVYEIDETNSLESTALIMKKKVDCIENVLTNVTFKQCIAFSNSQFRAESFHNYLLQRGWTVDVILGSHEQNVRTSTFAKFKTYQSRILIASDLMARGIDVENVNLVINLDVPIDSSTYLHRIGRCGRFGSHGIAITFTSGPKDLLSFRKLLGEIGGENMKVLKFPYQSKVPNNSLWNFEDRHLDSEIFGEISGLVENPIGNSMNTNGNEKRKAAGIKQLNFEKSISGDESENKKTENDIKHTIESNLELLDLCKLMIGDKNDKLLNIDKDLFASYNTEKDEISLETDDEKIDDYENAEANEEKNCISEDVIGHEFSNLKKCPTIMLKLFEEYDKEREAVDGSNLDENFSTPTMREKESKECNVSENSAFLQAIKNIDIKQNPVIEIPESTDKSLPNKVTRSKCSKKPSARIQKPANGNAYNIWHDMYSVQITQIHNYVHMVNQYTTLFK